MGDSNNYWEQLFLFQLINIISTGHKFCMRVSLHQVQTRRRCAAGHSVRLSEAASRGVPAVSLLRHEQSSVPGSEMCDDAAGPVHSVQTHDRPDRYVEH